MSQHPRHIYEFGPYRATGEAVPAHSQSFRSAARATIMRKRVRRNAMDIEIVGTYGGSAGSGGNLVMLERTPSIFSSWFEPPSTNPSVLQF
jgi:hypothetical protein